MKRKYLFKLTKGWLIACLMTVSLGVFSQNITVRGTVTDDTNLPVIGATVIVEGSTAIGTVTDVDGNYTLPNVPTDANLVFSYVGLQKQIISVNGQSTINVKMVSDTELLDELVVVGYGSVKKSDITGSVSSVPMELIENQPTVNLSDMLAGRVAGMVLNRTSGDLGGPSKIRIRGPNSILGGNSPLTVVDGVIGGSYGSVHEIESIEVLKDASATAIYGERASNGVILITTKKAKSGKPELKVMLNTGFSAMNTDYPDFMTAAEYAAYMNDQRDQEIFSASDIANFKKTGGTDWPDMVMRTALKQDYNISYSHRMEKLGVYISGRYLREQGIMVNSELGGNWTVRTNLDLTPIDRLTVNLDLIASKSQQINGGMSTGMDKSDPIMQAYNWSPTSPVWADEENKQYLRYDNYGALLENPYMIAMEADGKSWSQGLSAKLVGNYDITDWLTYNVTGFASQSASQSRSYNNIWISQQNVGASRGASDGFSWRLVNRVDLKKTFFDAHNFTLTGVYDAEAYEGWGVSGTGRQMPLPDLAQYYNIGLSNLQTVSSSFGESSRVAYLARLNYNYLSRYYLTASYRVDGQSGPVDRKEENKFGAFPSVALSWRISEESFLKDGFFDNLKLRLGWGQTGNPSGFPYTTMQGQNYNFGLGSNYIGYVPGTPANTNVKWETTTQKNVGLDFTILEEKLSVALDYFNKQTTDLLTRQELPGYFGYGGSASYTQNLGQIDNHGWEATVDYTPIRTADFFWGLNFNISRIRNEVIDLGNQAAFYTGGKANGMLDLEPYRVQEGLALGTMWGYKYLGIWQQDEATEAAKYGQAPGDIKVQDVNGDYAINYDEDGQKIGDANPDFVWGLNNAISYKNFDFNLTLQGMHGQDVFNLFRAIMSTPHPDARAIMLKGPATDYWTPQNTDAEFPNIHSSSNPKRLNTSQWIENGSWVKVKYIGVSYNLPRQLLNFADVRLSVNSTDLFTFSKYKGFDPEVSASGGNDLYGGVDFGTVPIPRTFIFGVAVTF